MYSRLLLTFAIMFAGLLIPPLFAVLSVDQQSMLVELPSILFLLVIVLSHFFKQGRSGFAALLMLVAYNLIQLRLQTPLAIGSTLLEYYFLVLLLPANLVLLLFLPERALFSFKALSYHAIFIFQAAAYYWFIQPEQLPLVTHLLTAIEPWLLALGDVSVLPNILLGLLICAVLTAAILMLFRDVASDQAFLSALLACTLTVVEFEQQWISASMFMMSAVVLLLCILKRSHEQAFIDELTGIPGRRALNIDLAQLTGKFSIAMLDIDRFKKFNDTYGHDIGDTVLKMVAVQLILVKGRGKVYRYGGEEFTIVFKGKSAADCVGYLDEIRLLIADYPFQIRQPIERRELQLDERNSKKGVDKTVNTKSKADSSITEVNKTVQVTISIGVAQGRSSMTCPEEVIKAADQLLYKAKEAGRNQVCA
ncbi:MAG: GGDEF domain-containing protein [Moritella sp.]|uniref:GGDEF domain-containing protein n=1 Tax=Moritella sp. TaxID=78556 RepID=UPI0029A27992|nr:GGDEF domain-containing protein [Moritella sp.]MDX2321822.1 GGDEF domain-containing protein [Moritella sp.]